MGRQRAREGWGRRQGRSTGALNVVLRNGRFVPPKGLRQENDRIRFAFQKNYSGSTVDSRKGGRNLFVSLALGTRKVMPLLRT